MRSAINRFAVLLVFTLITFSAHATGNSLVGKWKLVNQADKSDVGTLSADPKFFTLKLKDPKADFTAGYTQNPNGDFRSTIIDKKVLVMEGRFQDKDTISIDVMVKEIGKPEKQNWTLVAIRDN